jgi:hypothetical protein
VPESHPPLAKLPGHVFFCGLFFAVNFAPQWAHSVSGSGPHVSAHVCVSVVHTWGSVGQLWNILWRYTPYGTSFSRACPTPAYFAVIIPPAAMLISVARPTPRSSNGGVIGGG